MRRLWPVVKMLLWLVAAWTVMVTTHELGHILGGCCSGASLREAELRPWRLPYSLFDPDPHPLVTLWSGPGLGILIPVTAALIFRHRRAWFIASFSVLANGLYLGLGLTTDDKWLDSVKMLEHGARPWHILFFSAACLGTAYRPFRSELMQMLRSAKPAPLPDP